MNLAEVFRSTGVYCLTDGQYGSTGKGLAAAYLAHHLPKGRIDAVATNAGPNSGHTSYFGDTKIVLKQLPTYSVYKHLMGEEVPTYLTAGAVIDPATLSEEIRLWGVVPSVHPCAAVIIDEDKELDQATVAAVASTGKGTGPAIARKIARVGHGHIAKHHYLTNVPDFMPRMNRILLEVSQGYSLGVNQPFYPHVTSRECTAAQAMADAGISPMHFRGGVMCIRTYPIRVGNVGTASSGAHYSDQEETTWAAIGQKPELTTVTQRERRVFTFSWLQFRLSVLANTPTIIFVNFLNYLPSEKRRDFVERVRYESTQLLGYRPLLIGGYGPMVQDCEEV